MSDVHFQLNTTQTQQAYQLMPFSFAIGLEIGTDDQERYLFRLPFREQHIGNPMLPALHGGLIGGFLQSCMALFVHAQTSLDKPPKLIDFSIDYLRSGSPQDCYAECHIIRQGSRIINIQANMWQHDDLKPIAMARAHINVTQTA